MALNRRNPWNKAKDTMPVIDNLGALTNTIEATTTDVMAKKRITRASDNVSLLPSKKNAFLVLTSPMETTCRPDFRSSKLSASNDEVKTPPPRILVRIKAKPDNHPGVAESVTPIAPASKVFSAKTPCTPRTPKTICKVVCLLVSQLVTKLDDQIGAQCFMDAKDKVNYQQRANFYHACLLLMLQGLNGAELEVIYSTSLPMFFARLDKNEKRRLKKSFDNSYNDLEVRFITKITELADIWIALPASNAYSTRLCISKSIRKGYTPVFVHPEWARDYYMVGKSDDGLPLEGINFNAEDMLSLWEAPMVAYEVTTHPQSVLSSASLIVKVAAVKCGLVNVKMCEEKTRGLIREMQAFELPPTFDIKATLLAFQCMSKSFAEWGAELTKFLGYESLSSLPNSPIPVHSPLFVTSKQADIIRLGIENALPALKEEADVAETTATTRHEARLRAALNNLPDDPFIGPHNLLSLAPAVRFAEVQDALDARFCATNYHEQFVIMRDILL
ncbi:hypothetical protein MMC31_007136 [Peltigera leucophlebia]|nr:hypothetical protein [Peltigera leucophlebia]